MKQRTPIELNFYDENDQVIKTYSKSRVSWGMFKASLENKVPENGVIDEDNMKMIRQFVCEFFDNQFTEDELIAHTDVEEVLLVATQISYKVITIMREQGIKLPNPWAAAE